MDKEQQNLFNYIRNTACLVHMSLNGTTDFLKAERMSKTKNALGANAHQKLQETSNKVSKSLEMMDNSVSE